MMKPRALLYARVSTADKGQDWRAQLEELREVARLRGWEVVADHHDVTSGAKAIRPGLEEALARCRRCGSVDVFAATATDRFARSVPHLLEHVEDLDACGVKVSATREGALDPTTPQGRAFMIVRAAFAELERRLTSERVREGLAVRRARGQPLGRRRTIDHSLLSVARELHAGGESWSRIAGVLGGTRSAWSTAVSKLRAG